MTEIKESMQIKQIINEDIARARTNRQKYYLRDLLDEVKSSRKVDKSKKAITYVKRDRDRFSILCDEVKFYFTNMKIGVDDLERQRKAIIGYPEEVAYYKDRIEEYLKSNNLLKEEYPAWYSNLPSAIFHELFGLAGIVEWYEAKTDTLRFSSTAMIIGENIFFMLDGVMTPMPQKISADRRDQLRRALLSKDHRVRLDNDVPDIEMFSGERIKIFNENVTRENSDCIIFRKFPVRDYSFEQQIALGTYPKGILNFFKAMSKLGFNMAFTGAVRTSKTTQLSTWLSYEDQTKIGVIIETRAEIPFKEILPTAPILPLLIDNDEKLEQVRASIMRSDADWICCAEARTGVMFEIALKGASVGTRRCKFTGHFNTPFDFPYEFAKEIVRVYGGNVNDEAINVAKAYTVNLHFINYPNNIANKRLEGIYIFEYRADTYEIYIHTICKYDVLTDSWSFNYKITEDMERIGKEENYEAFKEMCLELKMLAEKYPMDEDVAKAIKPFYSRSGGDK